MRIKIIFSLRILCRLIYASFLFIPLIVYAENSISEYKSIHYQVTTDVSVEYARSIAGIMESSYYLYNQIFHFETSPPENLFRIRIFQHKRDFDAYLNTLISKQSDDYIYIHYNNPSKSEIVGYLTEKPNFRSLLHLGSIQFLKHIIPHPPFWLREGTATYVENASWNESMGTFELKPNFVWLESYKKLVRNEPSSSRMSLFELLTMKSEDELTNSPHFQQQAWGLVHYLLEVSDTKTNRIMWDAIAALSPTATLQQNSEKVLQRAFSWSDLNELQIQIDNFLLGLNTFSESMEMGIDYYSKGYLQKAELAFLSAIEIDGGNYIPYYYLGLINYSNKDYIKAEKNYQMALSINSTNALVDYAIGVNALADKQFTKAREYLDQAKVKDPIKYAENIKLLEAQFEEL